MALVHGNVQRVLSIILAIFELVAFSGFPFGFNAFIQIYKDAGVYAHLCSPAWSNTSSVSVSCTAQENMFAYAFMLWLISPAIICMPLGILLDKFGFRVGKIIAAVAFFLSAMLFAFTTADSPHFLFPAGFFGMIAGYALIMINTQASRLYPKVTSLLISFCSGSFDSSSVIFTLFVKILNAHALPSYTLLLVIYGILGGLVLLVSALLVFPVSSDDIFQILVECDADNADVVRAIEMPTKPKNAATVDKLSSSMQASDKLLAFESEKNLAIKVIDEQSLLRELYPSLWACVSSRFFLFTTLYFSILFLRFNYFLTSLGLYMKEKFHDDDVHYLSVCNYFLFCGVFLAPLAGSCIDFLRAHYSRRESLHCSSVLAWYGNHVQPLFGGTLLCVALALLLTLMNFASHSAVTYASFLCFAVFRGFLFCSMYACLIIAFPAHRFGIVYGLITLIAGLVSLLQYAMLNVARQSGMHWVTAGLAIFVLFSLVQPIQIVFYRWKKVTANHDRF